MFSLSLLAPLSALSRCAGERLPTAQMNGGKQNHNQFYSLASHGCEGDRNEELTYANDAPDSRPEPVMKESG